MRLRPYQQECLTRILTRYKQGKRRLLVSLPTGTGKTVVFAKMPEFLGMKKRMLVLAHRQELLEQAAAKFEAAAPGLRVGIEQGSSTAPDDARIVLASVPTVGRETSSRLLRLDPEQFYLIVVDEAHHAVAATYRRVFDHFGLFAKDTRRLLVGFTATPRRGDKLTLAEVFEEIAYARSLPEMVREGFLCPVRGWRVHTSVDIGAVRVRHGDFVESDLARAVDVPERNRLVVDAYERYAPGRQAVVFCVNVAHVQALAAAFEAQGIRAAPVWGAMSHERRREALRLFHDGVVSVLTNCNVLTEGFDDACASATEIPMNWTQFEGQFHQMKGHLKSKWGKLTDDDVQVVAGKKEKLLGKIQERYGIVKDEAEKQVDEWIAKLPGTSDPNKVEPKPS